MVNANQEAAFTNATGQSMGSLAVVIGGIAAVSIILWSAWVTLSYFQQWRKGINDVTFYDVTLSAIRTVIIMSLVFTIIE